MFKLAHLSDVHLGPLPRPGFASLLGKRVIGLMSWQFKRRKIHDMQRLNKIVCDIKQAGVDHVAMTGDLINIALPQEFANGQRWLNELGKPDKVSFVPGNHDAYVPYPWEGGLSKWADYMIGDLTLPGVRAEGNNQALFPYVRQRRNVALIGVASGVPAPWNKAWGEVGPRQMEALEKILKTLHERGFYRIIMIHHPPLPGLAPDRKALRDGDDFAAMLQRTGAELVLHGHNHRHMHNKIETPSGLCHVIGVPSASEVVSETDRGAAWYQFDVDRRSGAWTTQMTIRAVDRAGVAMSTTSQLCLDHHG